MPKKKQSAIEQHIAHNALAPNPSKKNQSAEIERRFWDDYDDIYRYYQDTTGRVQLTEKQSEQLSRWTWAREWMITYGMPTDREVVSVLTHQFGISDKQAYTDLKNTKRFFAAMEPVQKESEKAFMIERLKKRIKRLEADGSVKAEAAAIKAEELLAKVMGFMDKDETMPVPVIVHIQPTFSPQILGIEPITAQELDKVLARWSKKKEIKKKVEDEGEEYVDFEEILNGSTKGTLQ